MKRFPLPVLDASPGKHYWRSEDERLQRPEFEEQLAREFPPGASELGGVDRRSFLYLMGATTALAGLAGCRRPVEKILPYAKAPEHVIPGIPRYFATTLPAFGTAVGVLVESHENRPTKLEGNPDHPASLGGTLPQLQAAVLGLYDPDRSPAPLQEGQESTWEQAAQALKQAGAAADTDEGASVAVLVEDHRSPSLRRALDAFQARYPQASLFQYTPVSYDAVREGLALAFGRPLEPVLRLDRAERVVALDADLFGRDYSPIRQARDFMAGRRLDVHAEKKGHGGEAHGHGEQQAHTDLSALRMNRLYVVGASLNTTAATADHRLALRPSQVGAFVFALARELAQLGVAVPAAVRAAVAPIGMADFGKRPWVQELAKDLAAHRGRAVLIAGPHQPAVVHAVTHLLNHALGAVGQTVDYVTPFTPRTTDGRGLGALARLLRKGKTRTLLVLGGNPLFHAPPSIGLEAAFLAVPQRIHVGLDRDETAARSTLHINGAHPLESWGDLRASDGTASVVQPLIAPLHGGRTHCEVLEAFQGRATTAHDFVRATWEALLGADAEQGWRQALHDGLLAGSALPPEPVTPTGDALAAAVAAWAPPAPEDGTFEVDLQPDFHAWDGATANNGWLQETPEPMTKSTWDNVARIAPGDAARLGVKDGDLLTLDSAGHAVQVPALLAPGQALGTLHLTFGQGRRVVGKVGSGSGVDTYPLRSPTGAGVVRVKLTRAAGRRAVALTQEHHAMEGRPLVREGTLETLKHKPHFVDAMAEVHDLESIYANHAYREQKWGMVIDLTACVGCGACITSCQAENNIPLVGREGVANSREMHWLRIDRYFEGDDADAPRSVAMQPVTCHHCETAPCEAVCPVGATVHSPEGLNDMVYNRCIGTRYCANNCPYKVRRFNFLHYQSNLSEKTRMQLNPDVTVRGRGVMEKCTFCVQRINHAKVEAHKAGKDKVADGRIQTACQQGCPTQAITFGDLNDAKSQVSLRASDARNYRMLEELNVRPRLSYLARIRNPNPALEQA
ncbi:TAT-variant-translocated molybdopterin oxidoreductase [Myxococcus faecalis]|uniref:TAT-variant-translocated molybdopterin oxidoreductase n=1 Tax=Myxococcus faecalis TaxID=3115646 RepID=UPI003CEF1F3D